ncbi:MAG: hypothetical protein JW878_04120 [Methanomicrobia archaeon]|nr:hypothetical protein [Methanomicrobia archaeon]
MREAAMEKMLDASAKVGKRLGVGESVGRIWGFLLLKSRPVTQKEIEACTGLSRGMISQCLQGMGERTVVIVKREGREKYYSNNPSLATSYGELLGRQYEERLKQVIDFLSEFAETSEDDTLRESLLALRAEYKKVSFAFLLFPQIIALINGMNLDREDVKEKAKRIYIRLEDNRKEVEK